MHAVAYVELLQELHNAENEWINATTYFVQSISNDYTFLAPGQPQQVYFKDVSSTAHLETRHQYANEQYSRVLEDAQMMECKMGISHRWDPSSPKYQAASTYIAEHWYHHALHKLHCLVVLWLFELHKLNLRQTGEYTLETMVTDS